MFKKPMLKELVFLSILVAVLNKVAIVKDWYLPTSQFDILMHLFGGATIALSFIWFYFYSGFFAPEERSLKHFLIIGILGALSVGFLWEAFELAFGLMSLLGDGYTFDTTKDLIMDSIGALSACYYSYYTDPSNSLGQEKQNV